MSKLLLALTVAVVGIALLGVVAILVGWPTMLLWNWLMPMLFKLPQITFWQAVGLFCLTGILFKSSSTSSSKSE